MDLDFDKEHEILYSGSSFILGKVQWYLSRANSIIEELSVIPNNGKGFAFRPVSDTLTDFGKKYYGAEIHWWIYQNEQDHDDFLLQTENTYTAVEKMKKNAESLLLLESETYNGLIIKLKTFCEENHSDIQQLFEYTEWLGKKDPRAPKILFSFEGGWSSSELSHRYITINPEEQPEEVLRKQKFCTDLAFGLRDSLTETRTHIVSDICSNIAEGDPEHFSSIVLDQRVIDNQTSHKVMIEFFTFIKNIRDCLREIILEVDNFRQERYVIRTIDICATEKKIVRFGLAQLNYSLQPIIGQFGCEPKKSEIIKEKIKIAIQIAKENQVDIISFPELCFKKEWIEEILLLSDNLIIIGGSYYESASNICPIFINGHLIHPEYKKVNPSSFEGIEIENQKMKPGKFIYLYKTSLGIFSVLTCIDFEQVIHSIISDKQINIDFIINPCYDHQIGRFQNLANSICENNEITIVQINRSENQSGKFGRSGILSREHDSIINRLTIAKMRFQGDPQYLLAKTIGEELLIADINFEIKSPPLPLLGGYPGRINKVNKIPL